MYDRTINFSRIEELRRALDRTLTLTLTLTLTTSVEAAIDALMSMTTNEATNLRYESKKTILFKHSIRLKEMSKRMTDVAKELKIHHGIMSDSESSAR